MYGYPWWIRVENTDLKHTCTICKKGIVYRKGQTTAEYKAKVKAFVHAHTACKKEKPS
jgi:hypothetical protein